jgi:SAM-dependent methyltransferase
MAMNINWKLKSAVFGIIDLFSLQALLYFLQKNVTRRALVNISEVNKDWVIHLENMENLEAPCILEFGAGKNLAQNIYLSQYFSSQIVVDLFPMLDIDLFNKAALEISKITLRIPYKVSSSSSDIEGNYKIRYVAPLDIGRSPFPDDCFDGSISTNTLEHIPESEVVGIFRELKRIIRPNGLISAIIDYSDHYSHTDKNIGPLNFLRYSTLEFSKYNHKNHFQNRLRHYDYLKIFKELGYQVVEHKSLNKVAPPDCISDEFDVTDVSLCATKGIILLRVNK